MEREAGLPAAAVVGDGHGASTAGRQCYLANWHERSSVKVPWLSTTDSHRETHGHGNFQNYFQKKAINAPERLSRNTAIPGRNYVDRPTRGLVAGV